MASLSDYPLVSVIIVNRNGVDFIESCLNSVLGSKYLNLEVIFVDDASTDGSLDLIKRRFPSQSKIRIIENKSGLGPANGRNIGIENSMGKYVAFLDNDTEVEPSWLDALVAMFEREPRIGAAQSKLLLSDRRTIDSCGHYLSIFGFPYEIGSGEADNGQYGRITDIFGAKSAAMFIRRAVLDEVGYFDPDYFIYGEETDLCWRVWLHNYRIVYVPVSVVYHKRGGSLTGQSRYRIFYEGSKNCTKNLIKNLGPARMLVILPLHILAWLALAVFFVINGRSADSRGIINGLYWNIISAGKSLHDRKKVQDSRLTSDAELFPVMTGKLSILEFFRKGSGWVRRL